MPASMSSPIRSGVEDAGPSVQTILARRMAKVYTRPPMRSTCLAMFCACVVAACTVERDQPNLVGQDIRLTIIHTADIHSRLFPYRFSPNRFDAEDGLIVAPYGGVARTATTAHPTRSTPAPSSWPPLA